MLNFLVSELFVVLSKLYTVARYKLVAWKTALDFSNDRQPGVLNIALQYYCNTNKTIFCYSEFCWNNNCIYCVYEKNCLKNQPNQFVDQINIRKLFVDH